jgi:hypothetical protein
VVTLNHQRIAFGDNNRIGNRRYLQTGDKVYLVDDIHFPFISNGLNGLLDKRLLPASLQLSSLQLSNLSIRREQGNWVTDSASQNTGQLQQLIGNWQQLEASAIDSYDNSMTPLNKIRAETAEAGTIEFYLLSIQPEIILARPDLNLQYHFPDHYYYGLLALKQPETSNNSNNNE